ncbi:hypothetical protein L873DRAFT_733569 [Choiromyces venosus 120613-1]|uniref:Uncharacterized protein n=1 Tax=Choiromyces venosus 120613-1 TaxID=1336337 RepID=A0A3N4IT72_9PEZI|nr:hypothetical protein L873DRAFT_733569 [Choiromyces venosus 120613-1]
MLVDFITLVSFFFISSLFPSISLLLNSFYKDPTLFFTYSLPLELQPIIAISFDHINSFIILLIMFLID